MILKHRDILLGLYDSGDDIPYSLSATGDIFGLDDNAGISYIYLVNPSLSTYELSNSFSTGAGVNCLAYDAKRNHLFYASPTNTAGASNTLRFLNKNTGVTTSIYTSLYPSVVGSYYDNAFWSLQENTNTLRRYNLTYTNNLPTGVSSVETITLGFPNPSTTNAGGDIAINPITKTLFGSNVEYFYKVTDLDTNPTFSIIAGPGYSALGQHFSSLAFSSDFSILYGQRADPGQWTIINQQTGQFTDINFVTQLQGGNGFLDAASNYVVPQLLDTIYLAGDGANIFSASLSAKRTSLVYQTGLGSDRINTMSYDSNRKHLFFAYPDGNISNTGKLYYMNLYTNTFTALTAMSSIGFNGTSSSGATFFKNAVWMPVQGTNNIVKLSFEYTSNTPSISGFTLYTLNGPPNPATNNVLGDIAVNKKTGIAYIATSEYFYSINLNSNPSSTYTYITGGGWPVNNIGEYFSGLAFKDKNYAVLYGQGITTGKWYEINVTNGALTWVPGLTTTDTSGGFNDMASNFLG